MSIGSVNSPLSLQESQLIQILQQQSAFRAKANGTANPEDSATADAGQNLPGGKDIQGDSNLDPDLAPEKISALLLALQTQQASLDTTLLLGGSSRSSSGNTLVDYLTANNNVANSSIDGGFEGSGSGEDSAQTQSLTDYLG